MKLRISSIQRERGGERDRERERQTDRRRDRQTDAKKENERTAPRRTRSEPLCNHFATWPRPDWRNSLRSPVRPSMWTTTCSALPGNGASSFSQFNVPCHVPLKDTDRHLREVGKSEFAHWPLHCHHQNNPAVNTGGTDFSGYSRISGFRYLRKQSKKKKREKFLRCFLSVNLTFQDSDFNLVPPMV